MERDLNISLIAGILLANLPVWQWETKIQFLTGVLVITIIILMMLTWMQGKRTKKKNPVAATTKVR